MSDIRLAYIMSRFPKLTETFILYEILELEKLGLPVAIFPLIQTGEKVTHPAVAEVWPRVRFNPFLSVSILSANLYFLLRRPLDYLKMVWEILSGNLGSLNLFVGALGIWPKSVRMARQMQALGITHIHAHFATHPALSALIIHRLTGIPYSFTTHGHDIHIDLTMFAEKLAPARFAVVISEYNRRFLMEQVGPQVAEKLRLVHCGIDPSFFFPRETEPEGPFSILCVASFKEVKGHVYLVESCRLLREQGLDFRCHLVGDGPLEGEMRRLVQETGLAEVIHFHGPKPREQVAEMMRASHVVVLPSILASRGDREGIPVCLMEAMACQVPVVSSRLSGIPELVHHGENGLLAPERDGAALARCFLQLAADAELGRRFGRHGRQVVLAEFTIAENARRLAALFRDSAGRAP